MERELLESDDGEFHAVFCLLSSYSIATTLSERNVWGDKGHDRTGAVGVYDYGTVVPPV